MIKRINANNYIIVQTTGAPNADVKTDIRGDNIDKLSNMLVSLLKSYKDIGLNKEDLQVLVNLAYDKKAKD